MKNLPLLKRGQIAFAVSLLSVTCLGHRTAWAENLIENPGFEAESTVWQNFIPAGSKDKVQEFQIVTDNPHAGHSCAQCSATDFVRYGITVPSKGIPVAPGERYHFQAWVRFAGDSVSMTGAPQVYIRATLLKAPGVSSTDPLGHINIGLNGKMARDANVRKLSPRQESKDWQLISGVFEVPADTTCIVPTLFILGVQGKVYWDDVSFEKVPSDTPLTPDIANK